MSTIVRIEYRLGKVSGGNKTTKCGENVMY